jgi:hypothetical protein
MISFSGLGLSKVPRICSKVVFQRQKLNYRNDFSFFEYANQLLLKHVVGRNIYVNFFALSFEAVSKTKIFRII